MTTLAIAVVAALCLAFVDNLVVAAAFLSAPKLGGWLLAAGLAAALAGLALRQRWLIFAAQNAVMVLSIAHAIRGEPRIDAASAIYFLGAILLGNLLVWPMARAVSRFESLP